MYVIYRYILYLYFLYSSIYIYLYIYILYVWLSMYYMSVCHKPSQTQRERESSYVFCFFTDPSRKQSPHGFAQVPNHPQCPTSGPCWWRRLEGESSVNTGMTKTPILGFFERDLFLITIRFIVVTNLGKSFRTFFHTSWPAAHTHHAISTWNLFLRIRAGYE